MTTSAIKEKIQEDMKTAMRSHDKERLAVIRLIMAALKQREVDERIVLTDEQILAVLDKMVKQRRESIGMFETANRPDLVQKENDELRVIQGYLPEQLTASEIEAMIDSAIKETGAATARDMGKIMGILKPKLQGRADIAAVSNKIKEKLA